MEEINRYGEIISLGIEVLGFSILSILPNKETARALEAQAREAILKKADEAIYERRNASIEQERKIKENELDTEIAVENKNRLIKETQMDAERMVQQRKNQLEEEQANFRLSLEGTVQEKKNHLKEEQMGFEISLEEQRKSLIELSAANSKLEADAKSYELSAVLKAFEGMNPSLVQSLANIGMKPDKLIALAFQELAERAEKIGQLNISPDLLQELLKGSK